MFIGKIVSRNRSSTLGRSRGFVARSLFALCLLVPAVQAQAATTFVHGSGTCVGFYCGYGGGSQAFDTYEYSFSTTSTNQLVVSNIGGAFIDPAYHGAYPVVIDLWNGASWINILTTAFYGSNTYLSAILGGPINFATMTASKLRLTSDYEHGWNYHSVEDGMTYTLNTVGAVPVPAALPLLVAALGGLGLVGRRRRKSV